MFELIKIGQKDYQLKLTSRSTVLLEKKLNRNPLIIFMGMENGHLPTLEETLTMFFCSLQKFHPEIESEEKVYDLYDEYTEDGGTMFELLEVISKVVVNAGYTPKLREDEESKKKNA